MNILMVAAENGALAGGKVGGMGDVIRDIPGALTRLGQRVDIIMPGYQHFSTRADARYKTEVRVPFRGRHETVQLFELVDATGDPASRLWVLEHTDFAPSGAGVIYCDDPADRPFASDASKFALFCAATAQAIIDGVMDDYQVVHMHDWHSALLAVLARYHPRFRGIGDKTLVYTIHNLSLQGVRPLHGDVSSLHAWFPELQCDEGQVRDPRYPQCINPMRAAIRLCHKVHAVSPTYAGEIQQPSASERGFVGGEGLEFDLHQAATEGRLVGILNGCEYPEAAEPETIDEEPAFDEAPEIIDEEPAIDEELLYDEELEAIDEEHAEIARVSLSEIKEQLLQWISANQFVASVHYIASERINRWQKTEALESSILVTSVGRLTEQKVRILREPLADGRSGLEHILDCLEGRGLLLLLGSGDKGYEKFIAKVASARSNLLFLNGYSEQLSNLMYSHGDLFLMPSSFEPCGISQMLAMRAGQPCLVHGVGGLLDTVSDNETGFVFSGSSPTEQAENMVSRFAEVLALHERQPQEWQAVKDAAAACRFRWSDVANQYIQQLYNG